MKYRYNPACGCARCRAHGFMGPAVLITLGVLFLLDQMVHIYWMDFGRTWPALPNHVRVTIGTHDEMAKFKTAFESVMG